MPHKWCCKNKRDYSFQDSSGFGIERKIPLHFIICYYLEKYHGKESSDSSSLEILWQFPILFKQQQTPRSLFFLFVTRSENLWRPFGEEFLLDPFVCTLRPRRRQLSSLERTRRPFSYFWGVRPIASLRSSPNPQLLCQVVFQSSVAAVVFAAAFVREEANEQRRRRLVQLRFLFGSAFDASTSSSRAQDFQQLKLDSDQHSIKNVPLASRQITVSFLYHCQGWPSFFAEGSRAVGLRDQKQHQSSWAFEVHYQHQQ